jgi:hypothetical protein
VAGIGKPAEVSRPVNRDVALAIRNITVQTALIRRELPTLSANDVWEVIDWTGGKPREAASMLDLLHRRRTRPMAPQRR